MYRELLKRHWTLVVGSLLIVAFFVAHVSGMMNLGFVDRLENIAYDARLLFTMPKVKDERIVIVDVDEKSLAAEGRWPWGRDKLAHLVDQLFDHYQVKLTAFDVVFAEPDESSGLGVLESLARKELRDDSRFQTQLDRMRADLDHDRRFAQSLDGRAVIMGYYFTDPRESDEAPAAGVLPPPTFTKGQFSGRKINFLTANGYGANLERLQNSAAGAGHFVPFVDEDGVVRRVPMLYQFGGNYYESLSLAVARKAMGDLPVRLGFAPGAATGTGYAGLEWLELGDRIIPVDERVRTLVPYRGKQGSFTYVSATDVLKAAVPKAALTDKIVLLGTSAPGLLDLRAAPIQKIFPGVEIHANLIAGILDGNIKQNPAYTLGAEFIIVILAGLVMALLLPVLNPLWSAATTVVVGSIVVSTNLFIWQQGNLVLPLAATLLMILALFVFDMSYGYFVESLGKRQLAGLFGQYVPPELVEEMSGDPTAFSLEGESREMTVLFSDVRGFTTISEGLEPRELSELMNDYLTPMTQAIHQNRGTIDKYMGDAIMAFWGAPLKDPDHASHALDTSLEMIRRLAAIKLRFKERGWPEINIGVGLNTGQMSVGNMGSEFRMAYTVLGDAVNLGSRLEGLTKQYGVDIIVSESTRAAVSGHAFRELDRVRVKGKDKPVTIYEPLGAKDKLEKAVTDEMGLYAQALKLYRAQNWDMAEIQFLNLKQTAPARNLYTLYLERIAHFRGRPPGADWDGVFTHQTK